MKKVLLNILRNIRKKMKLNKHFLISITLILLGVIILAISFFKNSSLVMFIIGLLLTIIGMANADVAYNYQS